VVKVIRRKGQERIPSRVFLRRKHIEVPGEPIETRQQRPHELRSTVTKKFHEGKLRCDLDGKGPRASIHRF
jgi:hypothetical protein